MVIIVTMKPRYFRESKCLSLWLWCDVSHKPGEEEGGHWRVQERGGSGGSTPPPGWRRGGASDCQLSNNQSITVTLSIDDSRKHCWNCHLWVFSAFFVLFFFGRFLLHRQETVFSVRLSITQSCPQLGLLSLVRPLVSWPTFCLFSFWSINRKLPLLWDYPPVSDHNYIVQACDFHEKLSFYPEETLLCRHNIHSVSYTHLTLPTRRTV